MNVWPGVITMISGKSAITDLIGSSPMRLYPNVVPQAVTTFPALAYRTVGINANPSFDGASNLDHGMLDFWAYGTTKSSTENLIDTLRDELEDTRGTFNGLQVQNVRYMNSGSDAYEDSIEKYTKQIEFNVSYLR